MEEAVISDTDRNWMRTALELAGQAVDEGEVPVGAVLIYRDEVIGKGWNRSIRENDPTAHAEITALRMAACAMHNYRLPDTTLYVTLEPCAMCAGAIVHARVSRVVIGTPDPRTGAAGSVFQLLQSASLNHQCMITSGVLQEECAAIVQDFFQQKRKQKHA